MMPKNAENNRIFTIRNLEKSYYSSTETIRPIRDVSIDVSEGEFIMIYGPSGSGKTTLLNLIAGLDEPDEGSIYFLNERFDNKKDHDKTMIRRNQLGVIFQGFELIRSMTCRDNIAYPLILQGMSRDQQKERIESTAEALDVLEILHRKPESISGGQQQRIAIARALAPDYKCILGDEITGNLDRKTSHRVYQMLSSHKLDRKKAFILVSHDPELREYADRVYNLNEGILE